MATQAQVDANRVNSQKSSGPKTDAGKAKSSMNRLSHGFASNMNRLSHGFASNTRFIKGENPEEFHALLNDLTCEYHPATPTQQILVEMMAHNRWVSLRAIRIQADILGKMYMTVGGSLAIGGDVRANLPLLIRYQTTADRAFHKAHAELVRAQKQSEKSKIDFESKNAGQPVAPSPEVPAESPQAAKNTPQKEPPKTPSVVVEPVPMPTTDPRFASIDEELAWVMSAGIEEIKSSGL